MWIWLTMGAASAAPTFEGSTNDVAFANAIWPEAVACAGFEPAAPSVVTIDREFVGTPSIHKRVTKNEDGTLARIDLKPSATAIIFTNALGLAWFDSEDQAFNDGRAELLAECVARRRPKFVATIRSERFEAEDLGDLRTWKRTTPVDDDALAAYRRASYRLFRTLRDILEPVELWQVNGWAELDVALSKAGPRGELVRQALAGGAETQRAALSDPDSDGLVTLQERFMGTRPDVWDSDGNGWWDGAPDVDNAVPVARDGTPVCVPLQATSGTTRYVQGGAIRGFRIRERKLPKQDTPRFALNGGKNFAGGNWLQARGEDLQASKRCYWHPRISVFSDSDQTPERLEKLANAVLAADARYAAFGPTDRLVVTLRKEGRFLELGQGVEVPVKLLAELDDPAFASQIVAMSRLRKHTFEVDVTTVAFSEHVLGDGRQAVYTGAIRGEVKRATKRAEGCEDGWTSIIEETCRWYWRRAY